jgi:hypothetical protein
MKVLVTGDADEEITNTALDLFHLISPIELVIELGGKSAELNARFWADDNNVPVVTVREKTRLQTATEALKYKPNYVMAFPWYSVAVTDRAKRRGIQVGYVEIRDAKAQMDGGGGQAAEGDDAPDGEGGGQDYREAVPSGWQEE